MICAALAAMTPPMTAQMIATPLFCSREGSRRSHPNITAPQTIATSPPMVAPQMRMPPTLSHTAENGPGSGVGWSTASQSRVVAFCKRLMVVPFLWRLRALLIGVVGMGDGVAEGRRR